MRPARVVPTAQRHKAAGERKVADAGVVDRLPWQCRQWIGGIRRASTGLALWRRQGVVAGQGVTVLLVCVLRRLLRAAQICIGWTAVSVPLSANGSWRTSRRLSGFFGEGIKDIEFAVLLRVSCIRDATTRHQLTFASHFLQLCVRVRVFSPCKCMFMDVRLCICASAHVHAHHVCKALVLWPCRHRRLALRLQGIHASAWLCSCRWVLA